jgi:hypothetical protein
MPLESAEKSWQRREQRQTKLENDGIELEVPTWDPPSGSRFPESYVCDVL